MTISSSVSIASIVSIILVFIGFVITFVHLLHSAALRLQFNNLKKDVQDLKNAKTIGQKLDDVGKVIEDGTNIASKVGKVIVTDIDKIHV